MYSVVLMMAMTTGGDVAECHRQGGCAGGGCMGYYGGGCYGGSCTGYYGGGCSGGGHRFLGGGGGLFRHGGGGCYGGGCYGGGCYGGGCYGGGCYGGGCMGYGYGGYGGCTGGYGGYGGCTGGSMYYGPGGTYGPGGPYRPEEIKTMPKEEPKKTGQISAPATLIVSLPADAKLVVDDTPTNSTSAERTFVSPVLNPGVDYNYTLKAEVVRDGKKVQVEEKVTVRAGKETRVTLMPTLVAAR
jgi:uncharacterized protein (TIGR03000 family)